MYLTISWKFREGFQIIGMKKSLGLKTPPKFVLTTKEQELDGLPQQSNFYGNSSFYQISVVIMDLDKVYKFHVNMLFSPSIPTTSLSEINGKMSTLPIKQFIRPALKICLFPLSDPSLKDLGRQVGKLSLFFLSSMIHVPEEYYLIRIQCRNRTRKNPGNGKLQKKNLFTERVVNFFQPQRFRPQRGNKQYFNLGLSTFDIFLLFHQVILSVSRN